MGTWLYGNESQIKKELLKNEAVNYPNSEMSRMYNENSPKKDLNSIYNLEEILKSKIQFAQNDELKLGLKIVLTLISQKSKLSKAYALGKIYFLMDDEYIKEIIIKELKNLSHYTNRKTSECALNSLDAIALNLYKLTFFEIFINTIESLYDIIKFYASKLSLISLLSTKIGLKKESKTTIENYFYLEQYNDIIGKLLSFNHLNSLTIYFDKIEDLNNENTENELLNQYQNQILEFNKNNALNGLASLYIHTFKEKGHLRRLIALLDDDDHNVQKIGIDALIEISKILLKYPNSNNTSSSLISFNKFSFLKKIYQ